MLRCWSPPAAWASRRKRARRSGLSASPGIMVFTATSRLIRGSTASYTVPMPPRPRTFRIWYLPMRCTRLPSSFVGAPSSGDSTAGGVRDQAALRGIVAHGRRPGRRHRRDRPRPRGPRALGRPHRAEADGSGRGGSPAGIARGARAGPGRRRRRRGGDAHGPWYPLDPRGPLPCRTRGDRAAGRRAPGAGARLGAATRLPGTELPALRGAREPRDRRVSPARLMADAWQRNQYVTVAMVFVVFTGFAFVLP